MRADPDPEHAVVDLYGQCPMVKANTCNMSLGDCHPR
jgi:hypothetical protein